MNFIISYLRRCQLSQNTQTSNKLQMTNRHSIELHRIWMECVFWMCYQFSLKPDWVKSGKPTRELCNCAETVASVKRQRKDPNMLSFVASTCLEMLYLHGNEKKMLTYIKLTWNRNGELRNSTNLTSEVISILILREIQNEEHLLAVFRFDLSSHINGG